jgi:hypothetical protein
MAANEHRDDLDVFPAMSLIVIVLIAASGIVETANGDLWLNDLGGIVPIRPAELLQELKTHAYEVSTARFDRRVGHLALAVSAADTAP